MTERNDIHNFEEISHMSHVGINIYIGFAKICEY